MRKRVLCPIFMIVGGLVLAKAFGAQDRNAAEITERCGTTVAGLAPSAASVLSIQEIGGQAENEKKRPEPQSDNSRCVRIAIVDSQRAFKLSTEGKKFLAVADKLSKKKRDEEVSRIRTEMVAVVKKIAEEKGYGLVFDLGSSGIVCYYPPVDDITDELIDRYNFPKH